MPKQTFFNLPAEKRDRIIDVAIAEFLANDFQAASISRICANAEIPKGSFYQYFSGKEDLYLHLFELMTAAKREFLSNDLPDLGMGIFAFLRRLSEIGVAFELAHPRLSELGYRVAAANNLPAEFDTRIGQETLAFFRRLVAQGKAQGHIAEDYDEELVAFLLNTIFNELGRYLMQRAVIGNTRPDNARHFFESAKAQSLLNQTFDILEHGLKGEDPKNSKALEF